jgi:hypothetical protein
VILASDLVALATSAFGASALKSGLTGASDTDAALAIAAEGVRARVQSACSARIGWPLPGVWPAGSVDPRNPGTALSSGTTYADVWPADLFAHAIGLLLWRTQNAIEGQSSDQRKVGQSHEQYFNDLESGKVGLGIGGTTDKGPNIPIAARDFTGKALITGIPDRISITTKFEGDPFWEGVR